VELENGSAIGWRANSAGWRFGIGHTNGGLYIFRTSSDLGNNATPANYDFVINDAGNVGIGRTDPQQKLHVAGEFMRVDGVGNEQAYIGGDGVENDVQFGSLNPGITDVVFYNPASGTGMDVFAKSFQPGSSRRWKANIKPIEEALDKVQRLRGVNYDWKADGKHDIGLIAEEVGEVIPEIVTYEENGKDAKGLDYARLVALLIEAVKEQQKEIAELKVTVKSLAAAKHVGDKSVGE
jgi:hypothetical protein